MSDPYEFPDLSNGSCVGIDTELFFPANGVNICQTIKKMCADCPVVKACLTYALHVEVEGVWAGTGVNQRRLLRRDLGIKAVQIQTQYTSDAMMGQSKSAKEARARRARRLAEKEQVA